MSLPWNSILGGISHPRLAVRDAVFDYFGNGNCSDPNVTRRAIRSIAPYGWKDFAYWPHRFASLPLDKNTLPWVVEQIGRTDDEKPTDAMLKHLRRMLADAPLRVLIRHESQLLKSVDFEDVERNRITGRLELAYTHAEDCWRRLTQHCKTIAGAATTAEARIAEAELLLEPIVRAGHVFAPRVLEVLANDFVDYDDPLAWLSGLMIVLAGKMRLDEAVLPIYNKFHVDWDWYNEEALTALTRIASPHVLEVLQERYVDEPWYVRNYATGVLERVHTESTSETILALIDEEDDDFLRGQLGLALAKQLDAATADRARDLYWEDPDDRDRSEIRLALTAVSYLADYPLPERDKWEAEIQAEWLEFQKRLDQWQPTTSGPSSAG